MRTRRDDDRFAHLAIDDTVKATYGDQKQGAEYGYSGVKGLSAVIATISTPLTVLAGTRPRKGTVSSACGARPPWSTPSEPYSAVATPTRPCGRERWPPRRSPSSASSSGCARCATAPERWTSRSCGLH
ncbi:MAG TPA: hypothetical protein VFE45_02015, partial [Coriobacteriia bacterium]|nr:hypothetical protein [Coriobacteriia bacterium]